MQTIWIGALAVVAGVSFVFQQAINSNLRDELGYPYLAGFISYLGGTLAMLIMVLAMREPLLSASMITRTSAVSWTGGIFGAIYIAISIFTLPRTGVAAFLALLVLGQMVASLAFDHFGILGVPEHPIGIARILGVAFLVTGVVLMKI